MQEKIIRLKLVCIAVLILIVFISSCQRRVIANMDSQGENIICFGDSLTFGHNVETKDSYPSVLSKMLRRKVINAGGSGDTVAMALTRLKNDVIDKDPLLVIVILGANDFLQGISKRDTFSNLKDVIRVIKSKGAMVALGEIGPFAMYNYKQDYRKLADDENVLLIKDILGGIFGRPDFMSDNIHPNAKGYVEIAKKIYKAILPILEENKKARHYYE